MKLFLAIILAPFVFVYKVLEQACPLAWNGLRSAWAQKDEEPDAAWPTEKDFKNAGMTTATGFFIGVSQKKRRRLFVDGETSVIVAGLRGAGKTQAVTANIKSVRYRETKPHMIVADPAGDIEQATREVLEQAGYGIVTVNLVDPSEGNQYDVLTAIDLEPGQLENSAQNLAELLITAEPWNKYRHFVDLAQEFLRGLIVHMMQSQPNVSIGDIVQLILADKQKFEDTLKVMEHSANDFVRAGATVYGRVKGEEKGGFDSTLLRKLKPWLDPSMRQATTLGPDDHHWSFEEVLSSKKPIAIFIRTGLQRKEFGGHLIRVMMGNAVNSVKRQWDATHRPVENGLWVITDEAKMVGNCSPLVDVVNELRKARVNAFLSFHFLLDIKEVYSDWQSLVNGSALVVNGGSGDADLYRYVADFAGQRRAVTKSVSKGEGRNQESTHETKVPFITIKTLNDLTPEECVVKYRNMLAKIDKPYVVRERHGERWVEHL